MRSRLSEVFEVGGLAVAALSDGAPDRPLDEFFHGVNPADWAAALEITDAETSVPFNFDTFLIRGDGRTTLIDTGGSCARWEFRARVSCCWA